MPLDTPQLGRTLELRLFDLPADAAFLVLGLDNVATAIGSLPRDLGFAGMPGCAWRISTDLAVFLAGSNQQVVARLPIPNVQGLLGLTFYQQALVLDPAAGNAAGVVVSDATMAVVGG